jgi:Raf kinase inhibitor-like YbhB/YbcL family protein
MRALLPLLVLTLGHLAIAGCGDSRAAAARQPPEGAGLGLSIRSSAFEEDGPIPIRHTCDGADVSPPLTFGNSPENAATLALVVTDPDAPRGTFTHWVAWNLPVTEGLAESMPKEGTLETGARQGRNDFGRIGWGGPCPPAGPAHHYVFRAYALDASLELAPGASRAALDQAMQGHILAQGELVGTYSRAPQR